MIADQVRAVAGRFPVGGGQTFRVYEGGWLGSKEYGVCSLRNHIRSKCRRPFPAIPNRKLATQTTLNPQPPPAHLYMLSGAEAWAERNDSATGTQRFRPRRRQSLAGRRRRNAGD